MFVCHAIRNSIATSITASCIFYIALNTEEPSG